MSVENDALPTPEPAALDGESFEVIRAWVANKGLHCVVRVGQEDVRMWGVLLADLLRYVADAEQEERGADPQATVGTIMDQLMLDVSNLMREYAVKKRKGS
jgi:hypothetical protein